MINGDVRIVYVFWFFSLMCELTLGHRRIMHTAVGIQAIKGHRSFQGAEATLLLRDLIEKPESFARSIERYAISTAAIIGWGRRIDSTYRDV